MKLYLCSTILFFASCLTLHKQSQSVNDAPFTVKLPKGWTQFKLKGVDSFVGGFTNGLDSLFYDYGEHGQEIDGYESAKHLYLQDTINGLIAIIQIPKVDGDGIIKLSFPRVSEDDKFSVTGTNIKGTQQILNFFKSVIFNTSDRNLNGNLAIEKFNPYSNNNGRIVFIRNCASCHLKNKQLIGPALTQQLLYSRTDDWIYTFLTDRKKVSSDSAYLKRRSDFGGIECVQIPEIPKQNINQLITYLKGR